MYISIYMSYDKKDAEKIVMHQSRDLLEHTLKFLIFQASYNGEYTYWTKDLIGTLRPIMSACLNVKKGKTLKRGKVSELLFELWVTKALESETRGIYLNKKYSKMLKRFSTTEEFIESLNLDSIKTALQLLTDDIYSNEAYSAVELIERYFDNIHRLNSLPGS
jgi:hypothetical protein